MYLLPTLVVAAVPFLVAASPAQIPRASSPLMTIPLNKRSTFTNVDGSVNLSVLKDQAAAAIS